MPTHVKAHQVAREKVRKELEKHNTKARQEFGMGLFDKAKQVSLQRTKEEKKKQISKR